MMSGGFLQHFLNSHFRRSAQFLTMEPVQYRRFLNQIQSMSETQYHLFSQTRNSNAFGYGEYLTIKPYFTHVQIGINGFQIIGSLALNIFAAIQPKKCLDFGQKQTFEDGGVIKLNFTSSIIYFISYCIIIFHSPWCILQGRL